VANVTLERGETARPNRTKSPVKSVTIIVRWYQNKEGNRDQRVESRLVTIVKEKAMSMLTTIRRWMWIVPVLLGLVFIGAGVYMVSEGVSAKNVVKDTLVAEQITTAEDAAIPGVLVSNAATAQAQADVIQAHTLENTEGQTYAQMDREDPRRDLYVKAVTLRTALNTAVMGFKVADLVIGVGLIVGIIGVSNVLVLAPVLYWARGEAPTRERKQAPAVVPAGAAR
jgi:hypothetical protein